MKDTQKTLKLTQNPSPNLIQLCFLVPLVIKYYIMAKLLKHWNVQIC